MAGKSASTVAAEIVAQLGHSPKEGCIVVLQGAPRTSRNTHNSALSHTQPRSTQHLLRT